MCIIFLDIDFKWNTIRNIEVLSNTIQLHFLFDFNILKLNIIPFIFFSGHIEKLRMESPIILYYIKT